MRCILPEGSASCVQRTDDSLILQFTLRITFRCVLHRCESQDIRGVNRHSNKHAPRNNPEAQWFKTYSPKEVQVAFKEFDDSLNSASRTTYRISLVLHRCESQDIRGVNRHSNKHAPRDIPEAQSYSPKEVQVAFKELMITEFCNSHYV